MKAIKYYREKCGLTQCELAKVMGVTQGAVSQWESGVGNPRIELLPKIAKVLDCTVDELLRDEEVPVPTAV